MLIKIMITDMIVMIKIMLMKAKIVMMIQMLVRAVILRMIQMMMMMTAKILMMSSDCDDLDN